MNFRDLLEQFEQEVTKLEKKIHGFLSRMTFMSSVIQIHQKGRITLSAINMTDHQIATQTLAVTDIDSQPIPGVTISVTSSDTTLFTAVIDPATNIVTITPVAGAGTGQVTATATNPADGSTITATEDIVISLSAPGAISFGSPTITEKL